MRAIHWAAFSFALLFVASCHRADPNAPGMKPKKVVLERNVDVTTVSQQALVYRVETIGILEAEGQTDIAAGVSGVVDRVLFREGDEVKEGTSLITIDQERYQADEELARANHERAKENASLMREIAVRAERAGTGLSPEERARAIGNFRVADAELRSAAAAWARAKNHLERSRVRAPYDGRVNKRLVTKGSYLEEKTVIATIADMSRLRLVGFVPESAAPTLRDMLATQDDRLLGARVGMMLAGLTMPTIMPATAPWSVMQSDMVLSGYDPEFEVFALPGQRFFARIFYMSTVGSMDTHMFECKAEVLGWRLDGRTKAEPTKKNGSEEKPGPPIASLVMPTGIAAPSIAPNPVRRNPLEVFSTPQLWPGFTAKVRFPLSSSAHAAVIPEESVRNTEKGVIAFVPESVQRSDGTTGWVARTRVLDIGFRGEGWIEVRRGLRVGESVVQRGAEALEDGTPIKIGKR